MYSGYRRSEQSVRHISDPAIPLHANKETIAEYQRQYRAALSPGTLKHLDQSIKQFRMWCKGNGLSDEPPISPLQVSQYVESIGGTVGTQTIKNRVWAIGEMHKAQFLPSPSKHRLVTLTIRAIQRKYGTKVKQAPALCKAEVVEISNRLGDTPIDLRDRALLITASDSWCRASELVALRASDIEEHSDGSASLHLLNSKNDPYGRGEFAYLSPTGLNAVRRLIETSGKKQSDHLFTSFRGVSPHSPIVPTTVSRIFKKISGNRNVSAHSTRIGGVQDALRLGCDLVQIMTAGRWASPEMPAVYGRKLMTSKSAAASVCRAYEDLYR